MGACHLDNGAVSLAKTVKNIDSYRDPKKKSSSFSREKSEAPTTPKFPPTLDIFG